MHKLDIPPKHMKKGPEFGFFIGIGLVALLAIGIILVLVTSSGSND
jgi:tetrahydromethanopterin S-methyltransferase subunit B